MYARLFLASLLLAITASAQAVSGVGSRVENFRLLDHQGQSHELYYFSDMKAVVLMTHSIGCRPAENAVASLNQVSNQYGARGVQVFLLNSTAGDARDAVRKESERLSNKVPVLLDPLQLIGESLGATRAGETLVINPANWTVEYRGSVEGVPAAVDALASGKAVPRSSKKAKGCTVKLPEARRHAAHARVSYEKTIAPILEENCVTCHRQGGIGPWAMSNYEMVRGFAPMIREVLRTQRMPPWHADPHYGVFSNDRSLDASQTKTLVHWIEAGAPRGKGDDPLTKLSQVSSTWQLGQPDLVVEIPAFDVPATGTIPYQRPVVKNPLGRDVWVRAIEFIPTDRSVVHHILAGTTGAQRPGDELSGLQRISSLGTFVPGDVPHFLPDDTAVFIPKDADFAYQVHYTANGKPVREVTRIGLYFAKEQPKYTLRNTVLADTSIKIPANAKAHTASTSRTFTRDVLIYHLLVHAHVRGNGAEYVAQYPDGTKEILLSVPKYDFNWQTTYELATPKLLPKGTTLYYSTTYDNSSQNKANPNPNIEVRWGPQTWEEMLYGDIRFRYPDEALSNEERTRKPELTAAAEAESAAESGHPSN